MDDAIEGFQGSVIELLYNRGGVLHYKSKALKVTVHHAVQAQRLDLLARLLNHRSQDHWARQDVQGVECRSAEQLDSFCKSEVVAAINSNYNPDGWLPIHCAVLSLENSPELLQAMLPLVTSIDQPGELWGITALQLACVVGNEAAFDILLQAGASATCVGQTDRSAMSAIHLAAQHGQLAMARRLLEAGVSPMLETADGEHPLHIACQHLEVSNPDEAQRNPVRTSGEASWWPDVSREQRVALAEFLLLNLPEQADVSTPTGMTPLLFACQCGSMEVAKLLIDSGRVDMHRCSRDMQQSCLHLAAINGHTSLAVYLVENDPSLCEKQDVDGNTPLHGAAKMGHELLLRRECGFNLNGHSHNMTTPLHTALAHGNIKTMRVLLQRGADANLIDLVTECAPLHAAAAGAIVRALVVAGAHLDAEDSQGRTPLHVAMKRTNLQAAQELVLAALLDAPPSARESLIRQFPGIRLLHGKLAGSHPGQATRELMWRTVVLLTHGGEHLFPPEPGHVESSAWAVSFFNVILRGTMAACRDLVGATSDEDLMAAANDQGDTLLHAACQHREDDSAWERAKMLLEHGFDINHSHRASGGTPLYTALMYGNMLTARQLLGLGADPGVAVGATTPLHVAASKGALEMVELLLQRGADPQGHPAGAESGLASDYNWTPLHAAAKSSSAQAGAIVRALVAAGAHLDAEDSQGRTPLHVAMKRTNLQAAQELVLAALLDAPPSARESLIRQFPGIRLLHHKLAGSHPGQATRELMWRTVVLLTHGGEHLFPPEPGHVESSAWAVSYFNVILRGTMAACRDLVGATSDEDLMAAANDQGDTLLHAACQHREDDSAWERAKMLLEHGFDINHSHRASGGTPLHTALMYGNMLTARQLLGLGADPGVAVGATTPLHVAASKGALEMVELLLQRGADPQGHPAGAESGLASDYDWTPLHAAARSNAAQSSCPASRAVHMLLEAGANPNAADTRGVSVLMDAVRSRSSWLVDGLLLAGADPAHRDYLGNSVIHVAAHVAEPTVMSTLLGVLEERQPGGAKLALSACSRSDARAECGWAPLHALASSPCALYQLSTSEDSLYPYPGSSVGDESEAEDDRSGDIGGGEDRQEGPTLDPWSDTKSGEAPLEADSKDDSESKRAGSDPDADRDGDDGDDDDDENGANGAAWLEDLSHAVDSRAMYPGLATLLEMVRAGADISQRTARGQAPYQLVRSGNGAGGHIKSMLKSAGDKAVAFARSGDLQRLRQALDHGVNVNFVGFECGRSALHEAAAHREQAVLDFLLQHPDIDCLVKERPPEEGADNGNTNSGKQRTAAHLAADVGWHEGLMLLLHAEPRLVHVLDGDGQPPLFVALAHQANVRGRAMCVEAILSVDDSAASFVDREARTAMHVAAELGVLHSLKIAPLPNNDEPPIQRSLLAVLLDLGLSLGHTDRRGRTVLSHALTSGSRDCVEACLRAGVDMAAEGSAMPLQWAAQHHHMDLLQLMISQGANPNFMVSDGFSVLHHAVIAGLSSLVATLIDAGADVDKLTWQSRTEADARTSPLHLACQAGRTDIVQQLVDAGATVSLADASKSTPLYWAAWSGSVETAQVLMERDADIAARNCKWVTPLHVACQKDNPLLVRLLLERGADPAATTQDTHATALHLAAQSGSLGAAGAILARGHARLLHARNMTRQTPLHLAARGGHLRLCEALISKGAELQVKDDYGHRPLEAARPGPCRDMLEEMTEGIMRAAGQGNIHCIKRIHAKRGSATSCDVNGQTALHAAAARGDITVAQCLFELIGPDVMSTDNHGRTPLHAAAERGYEAFVRYLIDGREPGHLRDTLLEASDAKHYTALHYAVAGGFLQVVQALLGAHSDSACLANMQAKSDETGEVETALSLAVKGGFTLQLAQALLAAGAHPVGAGSTLHWACKYNHLELVDLLLQAQADPNVANCDNHVPLVYAVQGGHTAIIQRLVDGSADVNRDMDGNGTALHWACRSGNRQVAALLLRNQAACDVLDAHGNTPFMVAARLGYQDTLAELLRAGSHIRHAAPEDGTILHWAARTGEQEAVVAILEQPDSAAMLMQGDREGNTPFLLAAREGRLDAILKMADVWDGDLMQLWTQGNSRRVTPMHAACANDHLDIVEVALEHLQEIDEDRRHLLFTMQDSKDQTPLHSASASQSEAVHSILEQVEQNDPSKIRALVTCADSEQQTPLHIACQEGCLDHVSEYLLAAIRLRDEDPALLADLMRSENKEGLTPLHCAAAQNNTRVVQDICERAPEEVLRFQGRGTYLAWAAGKGMLSFVQELLKIGRGAEGRVLPESQPVCLKELAASVLTHRDKDSCTALHCAVRGGNVQVIEAIVEHAAALAPEAEADGGADDPSARAIRARAQRRELLSAKTRKRQSVLHLAAAGGRRAVLECVLRLSARAGPRVLDPDAKDVQGNTPLHVLCGTPGAAVEAVAELLRAGANVRATNRAGQQPLHLALLANNLELVVSDALTGSAAVTEPLPSGADPPHDEMRDTKRRSPLHYMSMGITEPSSQHRQLVKTCLARFGSDVNARDREGRTPLHQAVLAGCLQAVELLLAHGGVDVAARDSSDRGLVELLLAEQCDGQELEKARVTILRKLIKAGALSPPAASGAGLARAEPADALRLAIRNGHTQAARVLMDDAGLSLRQSGEAAALMARRAAEGDLRYVKLLLRAGVPTTCEVDGSSPLMAAIESGSLGVARELLHHGAILSANDHDRAAAMVRERSLAGEPSDAALVDLLLQAGAPIPRELMGHNALIREALAEMREDASHTERQVQVSVRAEALGSQVAQTFVRAENELAKLGMAIPELAHKQGPVAFVLVPDMGGRFWRGGYNYSGFEQDSKVFMNIAEGLAYGDLWREDWVECLGGWARAPAGTGKRGTRRLLLKLLCENCNRPDPGHDGYPCRKAPGELVDLLPGMQVGFKILPRDGHLASRVAGYFARGFSTPPDRQLSRIAGAVAAIRRKATADELACIAGEHANQQVSTALQELGNFLHEEDPGNRHPGNLSRIVMQGSVLYVCHRCLSRSAAANEGAPRPTRPFLRRQPPPDVSQPPVPDTAGPPRQRLVPPAEARPASASDIEILVTGEDGRSSIDAPSEYTSQDVMGRRLPSLSSLPSSVRRTGS
eukprot:jgi/Tetstr1/439110/TSEL_002975.t1